MAGPGQDLLLLYRARTAADIILEDELDQIALPRPRARVRYLLGDVGPLTPELFLHLVPDLTDRDAYPCGPPGHPRR